MTAPVTLYPPNRTSSFDPGNGLPVIVVDGTLFTDQTQLNNVLAAAAQQGVTLGSLPWSGSSRVHASPYVKTVTANGTTHSPGPEGDVDLGTIAGAGGGLSLTPTAIKTAAYSAAAGDLVRCDANAGGFNVTLPNSPADKTVVVVKKIDGTSAAPGPAVNVLCAGTDVFNKTGGGTSLTLTLSNQALFVQYQATGKIWTVIGDDLPLGALDSRYASLAFAPTGSTFHITSPDSGTTWKDLAGNTITARPTSRTDLRMICETAGTAGPSFAISGDLMYRTT